MSFWSGEKLKARSVAENLIRPFDEGSIDCAAYTLKLGGSAYTSGDADARKDGFSRGKTPGEWELEPGATLTIQSGQFAFLLTEESVTIPNDAVGFISIKATHKFAGLINVSGFHVDPGWSGPLIFAVFNAGPHELVFERGQPLFLLFYADLEQVSAKIKEDAPKYNRIPAALIQKMAGDVPSLFKLKKASTEMETNLQKLDGRATNAILMSRVALALASAGLIKALFFSAPPSQPIQPLGGASAQIGLPAVSSPPPGAISSAKLPASPPVIPQPATAPVPDTKPITQPVP